MNPRVRIPVIFAALCFWWSAFTHAASERQAVALNQDFLPVTSAFKISAVQAQDAVIVRFDAAAGYYLYQAKLTFTDQGGAAAFTHPLMPAGEAKQDPYFGDVIIYRGLTEVRLPLKALSGSGFELIVGYQGCAEKGLCYPPALTTFQFGHPKTAPAVDQPTPWGLLQAFVSGAQLVLASPMVFLVPLLGGLMVAGRLAAVSFTLTYAASEVLKSWFAARYGSSFPVHAYLQSAWLLAPLSAVLIGIAAHQSLPRQKLLTTNGRLIAAGGILGVVALCLSSGYFTTDIVQLLDALGEGGDSVEGVMTTIAHAGGAIFLLSALAAVSARPVLIWRYVERSIPVLSLGIAITQLSRLLPGEVSLGLWSLLAVSAGYIGCHNAKVKIARALSVLVLSYGLLGWVGMLKGEHHVSWPLHPNEWLSPATPTAPWVTVHNQAQLAAELAQARVAGIPTIVLWDADWCASCKHSPLDSVGDLSRSILTTGVKLLRVDVTSGSVESRELLKLHGLQVPGALEVVTGNPSDSPRRIVGDPTQSEVTSLISTAKAP